MKIIIEKYEKLVSLKSALKTHTLILIEGMDVCEFCGIKMFAGFYPEEINELGITIFDQYNIPDNYFLNCNEHMIRDIIE